MLFGIAGGACSLARDFDLLLILRFFLRLARIVSERTLLKAAFSLYALSLVMIPFVSNLLLLMIPVIIFGIAHGTCSPSIQVLLAGLAPTEYRAAFISLNGMFLRLGQTFGPLLMGLIYSIWGIGAVFYAGAGFSIAVFTSSILMIK